MSLSGLSTLLLTVLVSVCTSLWLGGAWKRASGGRLRVTGIEIVDDHRRVRGVIDMTKIGGRDVPQIVLRDEKGELSVMLTLNEKGEGTHYFNSRDKEGNVAIGYLSGSDVATPSGAGVSDEKDSTGAGGVGVRGPGLQTTGVGFINDGKAFGPLH